MSGGFCYATGIWTPRALPIKGKYSDYGTLNSVKKDLNTELLLQSFEKATVLSSETDRIKKIPSKLQGVLELIERGRIKDKNDYDDRPVMVGQALIREDIYQAILNYRLTDSHWYKLDLEWQKAEAEKYLQECFEKGRKFRSNDPSFGLAQALGWRDDLKEKNDFVKHSDYGASPPACIGRYKLWLEEVTCKKEPAEDRFEEFKKLLHGMVELLHVNRFMEETRKHWAPQSGKGSQDRDLEPYKFLSNEIIRAIERDEEERE